MNQPCLRIARSCIVMLPLMVLASIGGVGETRADARTGQVDALFAQMAGPRTPGCAVAVFQDGEIRYKRGYGMANLDHGIALQPSSVFHVASVSKQFTAAAVTLLAQEGRLSLNDSVRKHLPEVPDFGQPLTLRQLVHHTSGLRDQWQLLELSGWRYSHDLITDGDVMSLVRRQQALDFAPGSKYSYSNTGYTLLARIVERVSGQSFREFTTERLFAPLGMSSTHFRDDFTEIVPGMAYGYMPKGEGFRLSVTNFDTVGASSLLTTVEDLAKWERNFHDGRVGGPPLLRQMVERGVLSDGKPINYAFGLRLESYRGLPTIAHSGDDAGYLARFVRFPEQRFAIACLCNRGDVSPVALAEKIADIYLADRLQPVPDAPAVNLPAAQLISLVGMYVSPDGRKAEEVVLRDGRLWLASPLDSATELVPLGAERFRAGRREAVFSRPASRLTLIASGQEPRTFERVPAFKTSASQLAEYGGTYLSEEIELPYRVAMRDGELVVTSMKLVEGVRLRPIAGDLFSAEGIGLLRFTRNPQRRVCGMLMNTYSIVDFEFTEAGCAEGADSSLPMPSSTARAVHW